MTPSVGTKQWNVVGTTASARPLGALSDFFSTTCHLTGRMVHENMRQSIRAPRANHADESVRARTASIRLKESEMPLPYGKDEIWNGFDLLRWNDPLESPCQCHTVMD